VQESCIPIEIFLPKGFVGEKKNKGRVQTEGFVSPGREGGFTPSPPGAGVSS
jgi:hypothetical protein